MEEAQVSLAIFMWIVGGLLALLQLIGIGISSWVIGRVIDLGKAVVAMSGDIKAVESRESERAWIHERVATIDKDQGIMVNKISTIERSAERIERAVQVSSEKFEKSIDVIADKFEKKLLEVRALSMEQARTLLDTKQ